MIVVDTVEANATTEAAATAIATVTGVTETEVAVAEGTGIGTGTQTAVVAVVEGTLKTTDAHHATTTTAEEVSAAKRSLGPLVGTGTMLPAVIVEVEGKDGMGWARLRGDPRLPKGLLPCRRGNGRRQDGMFMLLDMSSIPLCKLSRQVHFPSNYCTWEYFLISSFFPRLGLFNLPGANRTQIPPILGIAGLPPPMPVQTFGMGIGSNPNLSRQSRRLYIGSITPDVNEQNLADFFNSKMIEMSIGTGGPGNPVLAVQCNYEKNYAFVEVGPSFHLWSGVELTMIYPFLFLVPKRRRCYSCDGLRWNYLYQRPPQNSSP